jgi:(1->4)-alpha-D-glucan 1-alpha-D-glucosylmutase
LGRPADARARQYQAFIEAGGEALQHHARFEALQAHFQAQDPEVWGWPRWPRAYHDPRGEAVAAFAREHADRVGFYLYLQWQFDQQIEAVQASAQSLGMVIGLYKDLAVSIDSGGADAWTGQGLYAAAASAGCPPDDFNLNGQDWGLLPFIPQRLMQTQFAAFIQALRANMRAAGALRLDHVMGLSRLFWVPRGALGTAGAYVTYPFDHLLAIVTLESQRQRCMVIGEDLGTVPDTVRTGMQLSRTLAYRVLYFSRTSDGGFLRPGDFPVDALVTATTHDLATLQGYWEGRDIALRERLNLYPRAGMAQAQREAREHDRVKLVEALDREGLLPEACRDVWPLRMSPALVTAVYRYLARTPSHVLTVQPEDVLGVADQVNLPGTVDEYDNWRRKLPLDVDAWGSDGRWQALGDALAAEGRGGLS